ncbi:MAG: hypothetical protein ACREPL_08780 [Rhodanobacteraceae bacterium]
MESDSISSSIVSHLPENGHHSKAARAVCGQNPTALAGFNANAPGLRRGRLRGGPKGERHGWRESIQLLASIHQMLDSGFHRR